MGTLFSACPSHSFNFCLQDPDKSTNEKRQLNVLAPEPKPSFDSDLGTESHTCLSLETESVLTRSSSQVSLAERPAPRVSCGQDALTPPPPQMRMFDADDINAHEEFHEHVDTRVGTGADIERNEIQMSTVSPPMPVGDTPAPSGSTLQMPVGDVPAPSASAPQAPVGDMSAPSGSTLQALDGDSDTTPKHKECVPSTSHERRKSSDGIPLVPSAGATRGEVTRSSSDARVIYARKDINIQASSKTSLSHHRKDGIIALAPRKSIVTQNGANTVNARSSGVTCGVEQTTVNQSASTGIRLSGYSAPIKDDKSTPTAPSSLQATRSFIEDDLPRRENTPTNETSQNASPRIRVAGDEANVFPFGQESDGASVGRGGAGGNQFAAQKDKDESRSDNRSSSHHAAPKLFEATFAVKPEDAKVELEAKGTDRDTSRAGYDKRPQCLVRQTAYLLR